METKFDNSVETIVRKTLNQENVTAGEFFRCTSGLGRDCDIFTRVKSKEARDLIYVSLSAAIPEMCERYNTYSAITDAVKVSLVKQERRMQLEQRIEEEKAKNFEEKIKDLKDKIKDYKEKIENCKEEIRQMCEKASTLTTLEKELQESFVSLKEEIDDDNENFDNEEEM